MKPRARITSVCGAQVLICLVLLVRFCGACGGGGWAWMGAGFYALLGGLVLAPRFDSLTGPLLQWALAVHACLVASMLMSGPACALCAGSAGLAVLLWILWLPLDPRRGWRRVAEFVPILLLAATMIRPASPGAVEANLAEAFEAELVVFESTDCPYCRRFREEILPKVRMGRPDLKVRSLEAVEYPFIRSVPTVLVRGPGGRQLFEGLPTAPALDAALDRVSANPEGRAGPRPVDPAARRAGSSRSDRDGS